ncbi:sulfite exporter TauE/SafE family protein [Haloarcula salinisoli]|uniref:Probable membrane transporter protein n=1 Tax=Haloarcula salinisoli TaxID=2487746 RepID=A0A8J7YG46_9EURY|nr:sulfite exporter TauE/SafE family protein [Halomicroarcula salinisoli]MBX0288222.1 sulfite exporter TauE/SafE family protein [Halomicroarcula salinisoli]MBX0305385.1 sulfite exporter TauE/SafE family protein [Halomicroarcula salinisoli]
MTTSSSSDSIQKAFLKYQHVFVFLAPLLFIVSVYFLAPTSGSGTGYWLEYWWLFFFFLLGATIVNTVGISGSALFVPFLIFIFPLLAGETLDSQTLVKIGLISESFGLSSSALAFVQYGLVDRKLALSLVLGAVPFVVAGALLSFVIPAPVFHALLGLALIAASVLLFKADLGHEEPGEASSEEAEVSADGGPELPDDSDKLGPAGVETAEDGTVTRVDREGDDYSYSRAGWLERFGNYSIGGVFQGLAGFGVGELGIISMLRTNVPVRIAIGTNHIVVALTAVLASLVHVFGGAVVPGGHSLDLASTPWNMVVWTVPATVTGGQIAPYVSAAIDTELIKKGVGILFGIIAVALFLMASGAV